MVEYFLSFIFGLCSISVTDPLLSTGKEWGEFLHLPGRKFEKFADIRAEIEHETDRLAGKNKGVNPVPINLKVYSPNVINLTLVDLPGTAKVAMGDQPTDIENQIRKMILTYIRKPTAIILAVTAANADLATSDALQLARSVDPQGTRTVGVLTKLDIMDRGTDAADILSNKVYPLQLGWVGVVNRSQQDIIDGKGIGAALRDEDGFFERSDLYRSVRGKCGTNYLARSLNKLLMDHIQSNLPDLRTKIAHMLQQKHNELVSYGDSILETSGQRGAMVLQIITTFAQNFKSALTGQAQDGNMAELSGGARISYIFNDVFATTLDKVDPAEGLTIDDIRTAMRNATGTRSSLFIPEASFELLVKRQIVRLEDPVLQVVELVYNELLRIVASLDSETLQRFQKLREALGVAVNRYFRRQLAPTREFASRLVKIELAFINTNHPDFSSATAAMAEMFNPDNPNSPFHRSDEKGGKDAGKGGRSLSPPKGGSMGRARAATAAGPSTSGSTKPGPNSSSLSGGGAGDDNKGVLSFFVGPRTATKRGASGAGEDSNGSTTRAAGANSSAQPRGAGPKEPRAIKLPPLPASISPDEFLSDREKMETELIFHLVTSYYAIVRKNLSDSVPKCIMHFLVNTVADGLQAELVTELYKEQSFDDLLSENPEIARKRKACHEMVDMLTRAGNILSVVRDTAVSMI